jgi:hypothetical protein
MLLVKVCTLGVKVNRVPGIYFLDILVRNVLCLVMESAMF